MNLILISILISLFMIFYISKCYDQYDILTTPLKNQTHEYFEIPIILYEPLNSKNKENLENLYNHIIFTKPEEYKSILAELNDSILNYKEEYNSLFKLMNQIINSQELLDKLTRENQVQSILGGKGIIELNLLKNNLQYTTHLLKNELNIINTSINNLQISINNDFNEPINYLLNKILLIKNNIEKYLYSFQLINVFKERCHVINQINLIISQNIMNINYLINTWNYVINEIDILSKQQLLPIIDNNHKKNHLIYSGNDIIKKIELINSILTNEILLKYSKSNNIQLKSQNYFNNNIIEFNDLNHKLIKEFNIIPFNLKNINISNESIQWIIEILPSLKNLINNPFSKLFIDNKNILNIDIIDINQKINEKISEIDHILNQLIQIKYDTNSIWFALKYLYKNEFLIKNYHQEFKSIIENHNLYIQNQQTNDYLYQQFINQKNKIQDLISNQNISQIHQNYISIKIIQCLNQFCQIYNNNNISNLIIYFNNNQDCIKFYVNQINLFKNNHQNYNSSYNIEYIIKYYISEFFLKNHHIQNQYHSNSIIHLFQKFQNSTLIYNINDINSDQKLYINDLIIKYINQYNQDLLLINNYFNNSNQILLDNQFILINQYLKNIQDIFYNYINQSINNKQDAFIIFNHLYKTLNIYTQELKEKELNNQQLITSIYIKFQEIKSIFNDFIAKFNLEFDRNDRINNQEFIYQTNQTIKYLNNEILILKNDFDQINNYIYEKHLQNISSLLIFVYSSKLLLNPKLIDDDIILNSIINTQTNINDPISILFKERYKYVLIQIGYYNEIYNQFKEKKIYLLQNENKINQKLNEIQNQILNKSKINIITPSIMQKIQKQRKIAEKIFIGYITLYINIYNSKSETIKNAIFSLDKVISNYKNQIKEFKKQNNIGNKIGFKKISKNFFNLKRYYKSKKHYKRMKTFDNYLDQKRKEIIEYLNYTDNNINLLNKDIIKIINYYLCKNNLKSDDFGKNNINNLINNIEPIQILIGDIYNIFSKLARIEYLYSPKYLMSISKLLNQILKEYHKINKEFNRIEKKILKLYLSQEKTIENVIHIVKAVITASYIIKKYNRLPKEYLRYNKKIGNNDIIDDLKHINIKGWNIEEVKKKLSLENELIIERKYIKNEEEFYEMEKEISKEIKNLSIIPEDINNNKNDEKSVIFFIPEELFEQILFELERNQLALKQGIIYNKDNSKNEIKSVINDLIELISKKRKDLYRKLSSKSFYIKQGECLNNVNININK